MGNSIGTLKEFIDAARRSRKYPENTAMALRTALRLFETELNEEELGSVETFKANLERIYQAVFDKNKTKYSSGSLDTYRKRVSKLLNDYMSYGTDPAKMNNWSPPVRKVGSPKPEKTKKTGFKSDERSNSGEQGDVELNVSGTRLDWPLADGRKAVIILPPDLTLDEAETIKQLIALRVSVKVAETSGS